MASAQIATRRAGADDDAKTAPPEAPKQTAAEAKRRAPAAVPPFTIKDLRRAIPPECFVKSLPISLAYLAADLLAVAALFAFSTQIPRLVSLIGPASPSSPSPSSAVALLLLPLARLAAGSLLWAAYWFLQGAHLTGLWVTAHECGHGAFSDFPRLNDAVGFVIHSALLVPYFSWKHSHRRHHSNTGSAERDEVFVPAFSPADRPLWHKGGYRFAHLAFQQLLGWPSYLLFNASGRAYSGPRRASHFDPWSPIFSPRERLGVALSGAGVAAAAALLWRAAGVYGAAAVFKVYGVPYALVNFWLVMITFLQHTHPSLPHYADGEWDWLRGALSTVDRSYGPYLDRAFHHIADTHVAHHLFSGMPHYRAVEATKAVKGALGDYYQRDGRNVFRAMWEDARDCHYAAEDEGGGAGGEGAGAGAAAAGRGEGEVAAAAAARGSIVTRGVLWYRSVAGAAAKAA